MGKKILQRDIPREQVSKLLANGKTDLLPRFISKKGKPFSAFLVLGNKGKVEFEFEKREKKPPAKKPAKQPEPEPGEAPGEAVAQQGTDQPGSPIRSSTGRPTKRP